MTQQPAVSSSTVDRHARDELVAVIEEYLQDKITAFQFDDRIMDISRYTTDKTVREVVGQLWYFYDDCKDHKAVLSREAWNFYQRILLLLKSDAHLHLARFRIWSLRQLVAGAALACFLVISLRLAWGYHLFIVAIPFGLISIALSKTKRQRLSASELEAAALLTPFESISQLLTVHRQVASFRKHAYPAHLGGRAIRSPAMDRALSLLQYLTWVLFSPVILFFQMLPACNGKVKIVLPTKSTT